MGMIISVYRDAGPDCSNDGLSKNFNNFVCMNVDGPFNPTLEMPPCWLVAGNIPKSAKIVVVDPTLKGSRPMAGGNYAGTSDSRWSKAVECLTGSYGGLVAIHDRFEY